MTNAQLNDIRSGRSPLTPAVLDELLADARAVVLASPSPPGALVRLHGFVIDELKHAVTNLGLAEDVQRRMGNAPDWKTAAKQALGI